MTDQEQSPYEQRIILVPKHTFQRLKVLAALYDLPIEDIVTRLAHQTLDNDSVSRLIKSFTRYYEPLENPPTISEATRQENAENTEDEAFSNIEKKLVSYFNRLNQIK